MLTKKNFQEIFNSFPNPSLILLPDPPRFTVVEANEEYTEALETPKSHLIDQSLFDVYPAIPVDCDSFSDLRKSLEQVLEKRAPQEMKNVKYQLRGNDQNRTEVRYWNHKNLPVSRENSGIGYIIHTITDVTDTILRKESGVREKKAKKALKEANKRLNTTLESIKDGFFAVNRNWTVTYWNREAEKLLNRKRHQILGKNLWEVYSPSGKITERYPDLIFYNEYQKVMNRRVASSFKGYYTPLDAWFDVSVYPSEDGISVFFKDITEQKYAESEKEHLMHVLGESLNEIYIFDCQSLKFMYVNESAVMNLDYTMEQLPDMTPLDIKPEYDLQSFQELIDPLKKGEKGKIVFETIHRRRNGSHYPVEVHLQLVEDGPKSVFMAIILDITDRIKAEEEREQLIRELSQNNRDLRQFSYITSHNLRSPITNLTSLIYLLENKTIENREVQEIFNDIRSSTKNLNEIIEDMTHILIIKDNPSIEREEVRFSDVFGKMLRQADYLIKKHNPRIIYDFSEAPSIIYHRSYLECIVLNLFTNSMKFQSPARRPKVVVTTRNRGNHVLLKFQDNGIGMDVEKHRNRLFGLYQTFHKHSDSKGLGLYLIKAQVEALGGSIEAKSSTGRGMTILIHFQK